MTRWTIRICVLLLLGAIVNVAVAWGLALLLSPYDGDKQQSIVKEPYTWAVWWDARPGVRWYLSGVYKGRRTDPDVGEHPAKLLPEWTRLKRHAEEYEPGPAFEWRGARGIGWPMLSMCSYSVGERSERIDGWSGLATGLPDWRAGGFGLPRVLPLVPIWPGFAINTLFYAAVLWLLLFARGTIRRWRRIGRGQCPACGYPVGASEVCTECGATLKQKSETQKAEIRNMKRPRERSGS